jgi:uncharacterized membrane protein YhaH (DUF805 family)
MNFPQAIVSGLKKYFTFSGRATKSEYWYWILFVTLVEVIILSIGVTIGLDVLSQLLQILLSGVALFQHLRSRSGACMTRIALACGCCHRGSPRFF